MSTAEAFGYLAAALVFATFYMRTMVRLRIIGIVSNIVFIIYAALESLVPVLVLHGLLLPLNALRLMQLYRLMREVQAAALGDLSLDALLPFMTARRAKAGHVLFRKGEPSKEMFYVVRGRVRLDELGLGVGEGETVGEISMFTATGERTATGVCEVDCELLSISNERVVQLFHQHPKFGFFLVRLITRRLIEDYNRLEARFAGRPLASEENTLPPVADRPTEHRMTRRFQRQIWGRRVVIAVIGFVLLVSSIVGVAPYLRSVLVRDAVVTTWIKTSSSPITGTLAANPPPVGHKVGADGHAITVVNEHLDNAEVSRAAARATQAERLVADRERHLNYFEQLRSERQDRFARYGRSFERKLKLATTNVRRELALLAERLRLARAEVARMERLRQRDTIAPAAAERAEAEVIDLQLEQAAREKELADLEVRLEAVANGVYLAADGKEADWAYLARDQLNLEIARAERELREAEAALEEARASAGAAEAALERQATAAVVLPPGSIVWSVPVGDDETVSAGEPVVQWIDCGIELVDAPFSDLEIALVRKDMHADVMLDGERGAVSGRVLHIRGSASTLGREDLAAVAERGTRSRGQVILELEPKPENAGSCRIGRRASVDFSTIGAIDYLRAWLRL